MKMELSFRDIQVVYRKAGKRKQGDEEMGRTNDKHKLQWQTSLTY